MRYIPGGRGGNPTQHKTSKLTSRGEKKQQTTSNKDLYFQVLNRFTKHKKKRKYKQGKKKNNASSDHKISTCAYQGRDCKQSSEAKKTTTNKQKQGGNSQGSRATLLEKDFLEVGGGGAWWYLFIFFPEVHSSCVQRLSPPPAPTRDVSKSRLRRSRAGGDEGSSDAPKNKTVVQQTKKKKNKSPFNPGQRDHREGGICHQSIAESLLATQLWADSGLLN